MEIYRPIDRVDRRSFEMNFEPYDPTLHHLLPIRSDRLLSRVRHMFHNPNHRNYVKLSAILFGPECIFGDYLIGRYMYK